MHVQGFRITWSMPPEVSKGSVCHGRGSPHREVAGRGRQPELREHRAERGARRCRPESHDACGQQGTPVTPYDDAHTAKACV